MRKKGFTLIELLVVIAIIALLLSILIPALSKVKEQARFIMCKSNLHNYGLVFMMYTAENRGSMPWPWESIYNQMGIYPVEFDRYCRWHNENMDLTRYPQYGGPLWPYIEEKGVNLCPAFKSISRTHGAGHPSHVPNVSGSTIVPQFGYSMNGYLGVNKTANETRDHVSKVSNVKRPANIFFFGEENMWTNDWANNVLNDNSLVAGGENLPFTDALATFHKAKDADMNEGVSNAVMADGHTEQVKAEDTYKLGWPF